MECSNNSLGWLNQDLEGIYELPHLEKIHNIQSRMAWNDWGYRTALEPSRSQASPRSWSPPLLTSISPSADSDASQTISGDQACSAQNSEPASLDLSASHPIVCPTCNKTFTQRYLYKYLSLPYISLDLTVLANTPSYTPVRTNALLWVAPQNFRCKKILLDTNKPFIIRYLGGKKCIVRCQGANIAELEQSGLVGETISFDI